MYAVTCCTGSGSDCGQALRRMARPNQPADDGLGHVAAADKADLQIVVIHLRLSFGSGSKQVRADPDAGAAFHYRRFEIG